MCAQKLTRWPAYSSARHKNEKMRKNNNKNRVAQKKRSVKAVPEE